jgi:nicotinamide riboside transporter PnuC
VGIVLSLFRWRDAWYVWLINNILDLSIWTVNLSKGNKNVEMMFIVSIMYLVMNVVGIICWVKIERRQKNNKLVNDA